MESDFYRKSFFIAAVLLLGYTLTRVLEPLWGPIGWGALLAFLFDPLHRRLTQRLRGRASLSAGILTVLTPVFVVGPLTLLGVVFVQQVAALVQHLERANLQQGGSAWLGRLEQHPWFDPLAGWIRDNLTVTASQVRAWAVDGAQALLKGAAAGGGRLVLGAAGSLFGFFLMLLLLFFLLRDGARLFEHLVALVPMEPQRRRKLIADLANVARAVVNGTGLIALLQGVLIGIGFAIAGLPAPVVFGVLAGIVSLLPAAGTPIFWVPAAFYLGANDRWGMAVFMTLWGVGIVIADNLLRPALISRRAPISELAVFIGVIGGVSAFGPLGLILGPVFLSLVVELLKFADQSFGQRD